MTACLDSSARKYSDSGRALKVEFLIPGPLSRHAGPMMDGLRFAVRAAGDEPVMANRYQGKAELLMLYGVGEASRDEARKKHIASGRHVVLWDLGYFGPDMNRNGYLRFSIDHEHPQAYLDRTKPDPARWDALQIPLRDDYELGGPIVLVGMGRKSRKYLNEPDWEASKLAEIRVRYPGIRIVYRPKPGHSYPELDVETDDLSPVDRLLRGASLVVCRHSNMAVDAVIAGVPFECEDGAAMWLRGKMFTYDNRLDFLRRLAWFQWKAKESNQAWKLIRGMVA